MNNIFECNPNLQEVYKTSDGNMFYAENAAQNHAKSLKDRKVVKLDRNTSKEEELSKKNNQKTKA